MTPWVNTQVAHLLSVQRAAAMVEDDQTGGNSNLGGYNEIVLPKNTETINAFSSHVIIAKAGIAHIGERIDVMTQAVCVKDGSLTQGLMIQNALYQVEIGEQECHRGSEKQHGLSPDPEEEDPCSEGSHGYSGTRAPCANQLDRGTGGGPHPSNTQVNCEAKAREVV